MKLSTTTTTVVSPTAREAAATTEALRVKRMNASVKIAAKAIGDLETAEAKTIGKVAVALHTAGREIVAAIARCDVSSVNAYARHAAGFGTRTAWKEHVASVRADKRDDTAQVPVPRQRTYARAYDVAQALGVKLESDDIASLVASYLAQTPIDPSAMYGPRSFVEWAKNGCEHHAIVAPVVKLGTPPAPVVKFSASSVAATVAQDLTGGQLVAVIAALNAIMKERDAAAIKSSANLTGKARLAADMATLTDLLAIAS